MSKLPPELREKFLNFHAVYEWTREQLEDEGASGKVISTRVWEAALEAVPLTPEELHQYKMVVALHSVNGGELFADEDVGL